MKTKLSVNVNKIATLRNSRGGSVPNVLQMAEDALHYGAHGITVHPRPDGRHIRHQDVLELSKMISAWNVKNSRKVEFNIEGFPDPSFIKLLKEIRPDQATLVPDPPDVLTSNAGWKFADNLIFLKKTVSDLNQLSIRSSLFLDAFQWNESEKNALLEIRPDRVELYTEAYAKNNATAETYLKVATEIKEMGIGINAGHDLDSKNIKNLLQKIPFIDEVSIGHALISEALYLGWQNTIKLYLSEMGH